MLYRSAKQDPERRFHALYDKAARSDMLARAWADVAANRGAPGVDGVTIADIRAGGAEAVGSFLEGIAEQLRAHIYRPAPLRRVHIPKPGKPGETRPLGIPLSTRCRSACGSGLSRPRATKCPNLSCRRSLADQDPGLQSAQRLRVPFVPEPASAGIGKWNHSRQDANGEARRPAQHPVGVLGRAWPSVDRPVDRFDEQGLVAGAYLDRDRWMVGGMVREEEL